MKDTKKQKWTCLALILVSIGWLWLLSFNARGTAQNSEMKMIRISPQAIDNSSSHK